MSANPTNHAGWAGGHAGEPSASAERRLGIPGKYHSVIVVAAGTTASFTGSQQGYGAFMLADGAEIRGTHIDVWGGGRISGVDLAKETIYDIATKEVAAKTSPVYVFKVQQG